MEGLFDTLCTVLSLFFIVFFMVVILLSVIVFIGAALVIAPIPSAFVCLIIFLIRSCQASSDSAEALSYAEITTTNGYSFIAESERNLYDSIENPNNIYLPNGETANVHFICPECNHEENLTLVPPTSQIFSCDCKNDNFIVVCVIVGEEPAESTE